MKISVFKALFLVLGVVWQVCAYADGFQYWIHVVDDVKVDAYNDNRISFDGQDPVAVMLAYYASKSRKNSYWRFIYTTGSERILSNREMILLEEEVDALLKRELDRDALWDLAVAGMRNGEDQMLSVLPGSEASKMRVQLAKGQPLKLSSFPLTEEWLQWSSKGGLVEFRDALRAAIKTGKPIVIGGHD